MATAANASARTKKLSVKLPSTKAINGPIMCISPWWVWADEDQRVTLDDGDTWKIERRVYFTRSI
jgi:hypothetical protein